MCAIDTYALKRRLRGQGSTKKLRELGFKPRKSLWELDHIVPLIDGGDHELSNLQTLCTPCHKRKTRREAWTRQAGRERAREHSILEEADRLLSKSEEILAKQVP